MLKIIDNRVSDSVLTFIGHAAYFCSQGCKEQGIIHKPMIYFHFCGANGSFQCRTQGKPGESLCRGVAGSYSLSLAVQTCPDSPLPSVKQNPVSMGHTERLPWSLGCSLVILLGMAHCSEQSSDKKMPIRVWVYISAGTPVIAVFGCISGTWE